MPKAAIPDAIIPVLNLPGLISNAYPTPAIWFFPCCCQRLWAIANFKSL
jgi:hypothetical protein